MFIGTSIHEIVSKVKNKELSVVDIANECLSVYKKFNCLYKVWTCFDRGIFIAAANNSDNRISKGGKIRDLEGIPIGVKDIFNTVDFPTQMGSPIWKNFTPGNDARLVHNLKESGGIIPGKTVTAEFAVHALSATLNPYDVTLTPGTSSSGSAVAVALGMTPVSIGTQTAGSIIRPASFCGVYGCKPSYGLIPRTGSLKTTDSLDTIGFFTTRFDNLRVIFNSCRVHGPNYPFSYQALKDVGRQTKPKSRPWKVAIVRPYVWDFVSEYAKQEFNNFIKKAEGTIGMELFDSELPLEMKESHHIHENIYNKSLSYYFKDEYQKDKLVSRTMNDLIEKGFDVSINEYHDALSKQNKLIHMMDKFFQNYDAIITLSTSGEAPPRDSVENVDSALMWTLTHLPTVSAPVFNSPNGNPFGLQIISRKYNDSLLFNFIDYLQSVDLIPESCNLNLGSIS